MTREKIAVSLPVELVEAARRAVETGEADSVSAYIAEAMQQRIDQQPIEDLIREDYERAGPPTEEETAWARRALGL